MSINVALECRLAGLYRIQLADADGNIHTDTGFFKNLITDTGMDQFGSATLAANNQGGTTNIPNRCAVGTGNTTPAFTDSALVNQIAMYPAAGASGQGSGTVSYVVGPPNYWSSIHTFTFPLGGVVGNIAEIGTGGTLLLATTIMTTISRALIVDSMGTPTTISVTSADQLIVTFELRHYIDLTDTPYSTTISGITYTGNIRRAELSTYSPTISYQVDGDTLPRGTYYNGSIGAVTSTPTGTGSSFNYAVVPSSYTGGTYFKSWSEASNVGDNNLSGGISAILFKSYSFGSWQMSVSPAIPKDATKTMSLSFSISWARYP